jgi:ATP synthase protein I
MRSEKENLWAMTGRYLSLAMLLPAATFVGYAIGYLLDKALGTTWLYLPFLLFGIAAGFIQLIRQLQKDVKS